MFRTVLLWLADRLPDWATRWRSWPCRDCGVAIVGPGICPACGEQEAARWTR